MKKIIFRLDCDYKFGFGHFFRSYSIAESIDKKEYRIYFVFNSIEKKIINILKKKNIKYFELDKIQNFSRSNEINDAKKTNFIIKNKIKKNIDYLIVDHYNLNYNWQKILSKSVKRLVVINDFINKKTYCDFFLNFFEEKLKEKFFSKKTKFLTGFENSVIQKFHFKIRKSFNTRKNIGFFFGASDKLSLTLKTIQKLIKIKNNKFLFNIFLGENNNDKSKVLKIAKKNKNIKIYFSKYNNSIFLLDTDFLISTSGYFNTERIYHNIPSINIYVNKNQKNFGQFLKKNALTEKIYLPEVYLRNINNILFKIKKYQKKNSINYNFEKFKPQFYNVNKLLNFLNINSERLYYKNAEDNLCTFIWKLKNDNETNKYSLNPGRISYLNHKKWFKTNKRKIKILFNNGEPIGQIRFDIKNNEGFIDYSVEKRQRGKGYGYKLIKDSLEEIKKLKCVNAIVHKNNIPSINIFQKLNFEKKVYKQDKKFYLFKKYENFKKT